MITLECICTECRQNQNKRSAGVSRYLTSKMNNTPDKNGILKRVVTTIKHTIS
jgi:hypothetical protein